MSDKLFPCPFCGGEALERGDPNARLARWVNCKTCNADMVGKTLDEAIAKWNRRSPVAEGGGWLPIDSAPKDGTRILVCWSTFDGHREILRWENDGWVGCESGYLMMKNAPTHWQPLPSPPAPSQEGASDTGDGSESPPTPR